MAVDALHVATKAGLGKLLSSAGFRCYGVTWNRLEDGLVAVVNLQRSRQTLPGVTKFALNIGVGFHVEQKSRSLKEWECPFELRTRVAQNGAGIEFSGSWWDVTPMTQSVAEAQIADATYCMRRYGLPWLDARKTVADVRKVLIDQLQRFVSNGAPQEVVDRYTRLIDRMTVLQPCAS
ncbi:MAG: DUF4304 domain-containing protein [Pseudomonadota bacterium]